MRHGSSRRRGVTSILAMLFLVLFSVLAIGFYASITTGVQIANNERHATNSLLAADSGMAFLPYRWSIFVVPATTTQGQLLPLVANNLASQMNGTANMGPMSVGYV